MDSEQAFGAAQISKGSDVSEGEGEAELIFVTDRTERKPTIFDVHTTTIPIIGNLGRTILQLVEVSVKTDIHSAAETEFPGAAVAEDGAKLAELLRRVEDASAGADIRDVQKSVACTHGKQSEMAVEKRSAGVYSASGKIIVEVPL